MCSIKQKEESPYRKTTFTFCFPDFVPFYFYLQFHHFIENNVFYIRSYPHPHNVCILSGGASAWRRRQNKCATLVSLPAHVEDQELTHHIEETEAMLKTPQHEIKNQIAKISELPLEVWKFQIQQELRRLADAVHGS